jgi:phasin
MESAMTNSFDTEAVMNTVKSAFAPMTGALKNFPNVEVPEAARDFVKKAAGTAKDRTAELRTGSEKVAAVIENAVADSVSETAKMSRNFQQAVYDDAHALFSGIDKLASAKTFNEAMTIQSDLMRAQGEVLSARAKVTSEYFGKLFAEGAKTAQENFAKVASSIKAA